MADFHQPRFVTTLHAIGTRRLRTDELAQRARASSKSVTLILPALAEEIDGRAFPRIVRLLAGNALLDRVIVVLGPGSLSQQRRTQELLADARLPISLVRLDDARLDAVKRHVEAAGLDVHPVGKGYACWVGMCVALAGPGSDVIAMHDCDILTYRPSMLTRLVSPLVMPDEPFDFAKGYYPRVTSTLYGRVTRLLVTPLLRALQDVNLASTLPAFLADFRYPLAGEVAFSRRFAETLPLHGGWGLEIGTLAEVYRRQRTFKACQVDIADAYDHRHRPMAAGGGSDLNTMTEQVVMTLTRALRQQNAGCDAQTMRYVLAHYRTEAGRCVDAYAADAAINGLTYDRDQEMATVTSFVASLERCIGQGLCAEATVHPSWLDLKRLAPAACDAFAELGIASELDPRPLEPESEDFNWTLSAN